MLNSIYAGIGVGALFQLALVNLAKRVVVQELGTTYKTHKELWDYVRRLTACGFQTDVLTICDPLVFDSPSLFARGEICAAR